MALGGEWGKGCWRSAAGEVDGVELGENVGKGEVDWEREGRNSSVCDESVLPRDMFCGTLGTGCVLHPTKTYPGLMPFSGRKAVCTRGGSHTGTGERASKPSSGSCPANHAVAAPGCIPVRTAVSVPTVGPICPRRGPSGAGGGEGDLEALAGGLGGGACLVLEGGAAERDGPRGRRPERGRVGIRGVLRE